MTRRRTAAVDPDEAYVERLGLWRDRAARALEAAARLLRRGRR